MTKEHTPEEIKYRLSNLGVQIGNIAINYITELEKACDETQELLDKQIEATYKLDKENAELKKKLKEELKTIADKDLSFVARFDALGRENAELKGKLKWLGSSTKCWFTNSPCRSCDEHDERLKSLGLCYIGQLNKAKDLIRDFLSVVIDYIDKEDKNYSFIVEAEQFLKEVSE